MERKICHIDLTVIDKDEEVTATGSVEFNGNGMDVAYTIAHVFEAIGLSKMEALVCSTKAVDLMNFSKEEVEE